MRTRTSNKIAWGIIGTGANAQTFARLFVGNERGGQTAATLSSLTSTYRRHRIDPQRYLTQLLTNLPATPISQIDRWLPDDWKQQNPSSSR